MTQHDEDALIMNTVQIVESAVSRLAYPTATIIEAICAAVAQERERAQRAETELATAKEMARNNAERSNTYYCAMKDAQEERDTLLEFIDLTIERREEFAEYRANIKGET